MTAARPARYRPARMTDTERATFRETVDLLAGRAGCEIDGCTDKARDRFGPSRLCDAHAAEAMAAAYAMEGAL